MRGDPELRSQLFRMEEARRQTQRQLDLIDRQIIRRMTALIPHLGRRQSAYRRVRAPDPSAFLERYRSNLAAITAARQPEIDALSRKLARQDAAIEGFKAKNRLDPVDARSRVQHCGQPAMVSACARTPCEGRGP
ncbi:hypothetical protein [Mesorhizobium sp. M1A.T.Ca.IN.004.03.1.1]|uniref:hypothetical protein n=1 Tax=Mesorhizobium sp. M1A.T.Ca.IN.004.03.1.1 TaxID=2496795 RepID=UPI001FDF0557|nr:hypothetical protein [Mesorhizobium sp. M1A.T.Ca.IN.004.03.1.1]